MNTTLGFLLSAMLLLICASIGATANARTVPVAARARTIFSIQFVIMFLSSLDPKRACLNRPQAVVKHVELVTEHHRVDAVGVPDDHDLCARRPPAPLVL